MLFTRRFRRVIFCKNRLQIPCPPEFAVKNITDTLVGIRYIWRRTRDLLFRDAPFRLSGSVRTECFHQLSPCYNIFSRVKPLQPVRDYSNSLLKL